jgi:hypothetical protein
MREREDDDLEPPVTWAFPDPDDLSSSRSREADERNAAGDSEAAAGTTRRLVAVSVR